MLSAIKHMLKVMLDACHIDIFALNPIASYPEFEKGLTVSRQTSTGKSLPVWFPRTRQLFHFVATALVRLLRLKRFPSPPSDGIIFVVGTRNQSHALQPIYDKIEENKFWFDENSISSIRRLASVFALPYLPCLLYRMFLSKGYRFKSFRMSLTTYWQTFGTYIATRIWLRKSAPASVVFGNDHVGFYRTFNEAARQEGVPTFYVQHACVADYFPPLEYRYALLDGLDAADKYANKPGASEIFLTGIAKFEADETRPRSDHDTVGLSFNLLDGESFITELLSEMADRFPEKSLICRLHPSTPAALQERVNRHCEQLEIQVSDAKSESVFDYVDRIDIMVCGASSIILEAALKGVQSIALFSEHASDVYGFVKNGLCPMANNVDELISMIEKPRDHQQLVAATEYYCAGYGEQNRPEAATLAAQIISNPTDESLKKDWISLENQKHANVLQFQLHGSQSE